MTAATPLTDGSGPIEAATSALVGWLETVTGTTVELAPPADIDQDDPPVAVWPLQLCPERELRNSRHREPLRFQVRHLVTGPAAALDSALVAATVAGDPTVTMTSADDQIWLALRRIPRIALLINMPAVIARPTPDIPIVTEPLLLDLVDKNHLEEP